MTTDENQGDQSAYDSPSNDQLQQSDDLVESGDQENSFDEGDLKEPEAGEKNNEQSLTSVGFILTSKFISFKSRFSIFSS